MRRKKWFLGLTILALFAAGIATRAALSRLTEPRRPAYTLTSEATQYDPDGKPRRLFVETRYVSSSGNWHAIQRYDNGMVIDTFGVVGQGVFARRNNDGRLNFLSAYDHPTPLLTAEGFRQHGYSRTETLLGHQVFVTNASNDARAEFYSDPSLGGATIKRVQKSDRTTIVIEPVALLMGEPSPSAFLMPDGLTVSYDSYNKLHKLP